MSQAIGIDIGGTKIAAGRVSPEGEIDNLRELPTPRSGREMFETTRDLSSELMMEKVTAIGLGIAGLVRFEEGTFVWGPHLGGADLPFGPELRGDFGIPVAVDNDANVAGLAEARLGAGAGMRHVLTVTVGTGIGGAITSGGRIFRGRAFAAEFGHMSVAAEGPTCDCGRTGCWETLASGRRLDELADEAAAREPDGAIARAAGSGRATGRHVTAAAQAGDRAALAIVKEIGMWLGIGLANLIAAFDPDVLVIGGGVSRRGEILLESARQTARRATFGASVRQSTPVVSAAFGHLAGVVGAGLLALEFSEGSEIP